MKGYYKKRSYANLGVNILREISKKNFLRNVEMTERMSYDTYWQVVYFHNHHKDITRLYVLQVDLIWIEIKLIID